MYKLSLNSKNKNVDDYLYEEDLIIEKEFKTADEKYKIPPKNNFKLNILAIPNISETNNINYISIYN